MSIKRYKPEQIVTGGWPTLPACDSSPREAFVEGCPTL